jgi:hypothetical protein
VSDLGGRIVKTTGDGLLMEFPSVVAAVECAIAIQKLMAERNAEMPEDKRPVLRALSLCTCCRQYPGAAAGRRRRRLEPRRDVDAVADNVVAVDQHVAEVDADAVDDASGGVFISGTAYDHVRGRVDATFVDIGERTLKNIAQPVRVYAIKPSSQSTVFAQPTFAPEKSVLPRLSMVVLPSPVHDPAGAR